MAVRFAVPLLLLVPASESVATAVQAVRMAGEVMDLVDKNNMPCFLAFDLKLPTFAYDYDMHNVNSALDYDKVALPYLSEEKGDGS